MKRREITAEHLLKVLLEQEEGIVVPLVKKLGVDLNGLAGELDHSRLSFHPELDSAEAGDVIMF